ncbi:hypothetical protein C8R43DRAFT_1143542 [Mycena crocata]|nr:hypothetical protein C8R43DRAFT_1143542 [Mycena crocata]
MSFPPEIWERAWRHASPEDLQNISSSCRLFHQISRSLLFEKLNHTGPDLPDLITTRCPATANTMLKKMEHKRERLLSIASRTHIAVTVRSWTFKASALITTLREEEPNLPGLDPTLKLIIDICYAIESDFRSTIGSYTHLSTLVVTGFNFSPEFCQTLTSLPNLSIMDEFSYECYTPLWKWDQKVHEYHLVSPSNLEKLKIMDPEPAKEFLSVFVAAGPAPHLVSLTLSLGNEAQDLLYRFLHCCPALKDIELDTPTDFADDVVLASTSIPLLCSFVGRMEVARTLAPGRPIQKLYLNHAQRDEEYDEPVAKTTMQEVLVQLSKSTAVVKELTLPLIPLDSSVLCLIAQLFPKLEHLAFFLQNANDDDDDSNGDIDEVQDIQFDNESAHPGNGDGDWIPFTLLSGNIALPSNLFALSSKESHQCDEDSDCCNGEPGEDWTSEYSDSTAYLSDLEGIPNSEDTTADRTAYKDFELISYKNFMLSLGDDFIPLPLNIRFLAIRQAPGNYTKDHMSDADIVTVVEKLSARYMRLSHIVAGEKQQTWKRRGGVWKAQKHTHPCTRYLEY